MKRKCIYCGETDVNEFTKKEHVLMQSFGTFGSNTPTLDCVCNTCNKFFGDSIDQTFSRNSLEGITRYKKGIYSREKRKQSPGYLTITLPETEEFGDWGGMAIWIDGITGKIMPPFPQVHLLDDQGVYVVLFKTDLANLDWKSRGYSDKKIKIFAPTQEGHEGIVSDLELIGINYQLTNTFTPDFFEKYKNGEIPVSIKGTIDKTIKRALVKILFNFSAKYLGEEEVIKKEWDYTRGYVRYEERDIESKATSNGFWGQETRELRYPDNAYNIRIENNKNNVVGGIQFFNLYLYEFILVENYRITQEIAARFVPGQDPIFGKKYDAVDFAGYKVPIIK